LGKGFQCKPLGVAAGSAFLVIITVQELTYAANEIEATYDVPFAAFLSAALCHWPLCLDVNVGVRAVPGRAEFFR
jgi:polar amino acid transport system permease protein